MKEIAFLFLFINCDTVEFFKFFRGHLFYFHRSINDAENQDGRSDVKRIDHRIGNCSFVGYIADTYPGKDKRKQIAYETARIAQEALDGVGESFLLFVDHISYKHFERLHGHIYGSIQEHERY